MIKAEHRWILPSISRKPKSLTSSANTAEKVVRKTPFMRQHGLETLKLSNSIWILAWM